MKSFLKSKPGLISVVAFTVMMGLVLHRVVNRRHERAAAAKLPVANAATTPNRRPAGIASPAAARVPLPAPRRTDDLAENAAYLERYYDLDARTRYDHDQRGNRVTRRETTGARVEAGGPAESPEPGSTPAGALPVRTSLRLVGKFTPAAGKPSRTAESAPSVSGPLGATDRAASPALGTRTEVTRPRPQRFNPYGRVIKCELVFTIDSTSEQCPLVGIVMEPVYNNGALIIPAGAELHGLARPDRLRDRIFSGQEWVLVFPRQQARLSGRQLNVKGVALDRIEPDANGMTWGITDGSYGLEGRVIRTMNDEEIKRFVATFLAGSSVALQDRNTDRTGQQSVRNTPQNAVLQGLAANFEKIAEEISAEIAQHGVFIRVPAGHQFYFYPMQIIDPDAADISSDVATVK